MMKRRDFLKEIRGLSTEDKSGRVSGHAEEMMKLRFRSAAGQLDQTHNVRMTKKKLARVKTLLREEALKGN